MLPQSSCIPGNVTSLNWKEGGFTDIIDQGSGRDQATVLDVGLSNFLAEIGLTSGFIGTASLFGIIGYTTDSDSGEVNTFEGRIGFHKKWKADQ
ncbi:hypothetical protein [Microbulbifer agarilyticus]|uniref:hypothetical protein n=1 Tax=Microbulbifer agarilyticus TaxID=260552 RepID=UPI001CD61CB9|nr:hypothetical protein [Microbulbifer agarilyticus]MCA0899556.1 hypothetical protein [Microbulbifer agarilyticus]